MTDLDRIDATVTEESHASCDIDFFVDDTYAGSVHAVLCSYMWMVDHESLDLPQIFGLADQSPDRLAAVISRHIAAGLDPAF